MVVTCNPGVIHFVNVAFFCSKLCAEWWSTVHGTSYSSGTLLCSVIPFQAFHLTADVSRNNI